MKHPIGDWRGNKSWIFGGAESIQRTIVIAYSVITLYGVMKDTETTSENALDFCPPGLTLQQASTNFGPMSIGGLFLVICGKQIHRSSSIECGRSSRTLSSIVILLKILSSTEEVTTWTSLQK